jgi:hypothetical protein
VGRERGAGKVAVGEPDRGSVAVGFQLGVDALPPQPAPLLRLSPRLVPLRRRNVQLWQQNTHTGRLTGAMLDGVFLRARELLEEDPQTR